MQNKRQRILVLGAIGTILLVAGFFIYWVFLQADSGMSKEWLKEAQVAAKSIDASRCAQLQEMDVDTASENSLHLKKELVNILAATPTCHFLYLLGKKSDGTLQVLADSEQGNTSDFATIGEAHAPPTAAFLQVFTTGESVIEGPYFDKCGRLISAIVPVVDPNTGDVLAVLGMAMEVTVWHQELFYRVAQPIGLTLALLLAATVALLTSFGHISTQKTLIQQLLPALGTMVVIMTVGGGILSWTLYQMNLATQSEYHITETAKELQLALKLQTNALKALTQTIAATPGVQKCLQRGDAEQLKLDYEGVFQRLKKENSITHFYFFDKKRTCLLRLHHPEKRGDLIDRLTARQAEQTGEIASGVELGILGTLTLRIVCPVFEGLAHVGYVELGIEIDDLLKNLPMEEGSLSAILLNKELLSRKEWEAGQQIAGKSAEWNRFPRSVVNFTSQGELPDAFAKHVDRPTQDHGVAKTVLYDGKDWDVQKFPLQDAAGQNVGTLMVMHDITTDKVVSVRILTLTGMAGAAVLFLLLGSIYFLLRRADKRMIAQQAVVLDSEERYRQLFQRAKDGCIIFDPVAHRHVSCNQVFREIFKISEAFDITQLPMDAIFPERQPDGQLSSEKGGKILALVMQNGSYDGEWTYQRSNGELFPATVLITRLDLAKQVLLQATISDITKIKQVEEQNLYLQKSVEYSPVLIVITNPDGIIEYVNSKFCEVSGYTKEEALGQKPSILKSGKMDSAIYDAMWETITKGGVWVGELQNKKRSGELYWESVNISSIKNDNGEITHYVALKEDITIRKETEMQLLITNEQLEIALVKAEKANVAKSEFLANMSHEIRTPMNGVIGMTGLLIDTPLSVDQRRYVETVHASGEALLAIINDILDFSKIEAGKLEIETIDFDLTSLLEDFADTMAMKVHEKGLEIICAAAPSVPTLLQGDPGRLRQILANLVGNAIKFTQQGEVAIRVFCLQELGEEVSLRFSIKDTGIGIAQEKIGILFDKFTQADASTTRNYGGTGLGLAISKQLVELMGGEIGVESELGKGSEFWFTLRLRKQHRRVRLDLPTPDLQGIRILVVDDSVTNREILYTRLLSWGMRATEVSSGEEGFPILEQAVEAGDPFRIAIIDMQMPGMDGYSLGQLIRADTRFTDLRLVVLTSMGAPGDVRRFKEIGFNGYATKPLRHDEMKRILVLTLQNPDTSLLSVITRHTVRESAKIFAGSKARILLAEDNHTNQQVCIGILKKLGLSADIASNGKEALYAIENCRYDLIFMDVQMPEMDGLTATREIRKQEVKMKKEGAEGICIIAMTANAMQGDREACLEAGMNDYLAKPVSTHSVSEILKKWLPSEDIGFSQDLEPSLPTADPPPPPETTQPAVLPVFDRASLESRLGSDEELIAMVIQSFLHEIPTMIETMQQCVKDGDANAMRNQAHKIKGAAANLGAERVRSLAAVMEGAAKTGEVADVLDQMPTLLAEFEVLEIALTNKL